MKGVRFGEYHSFDEWGLVLSSKDIQAPEPKIMQIDIPGGDGVLDLTDYFGDTKYNNRLLSFTFSRAFAVPGEYLALYSTVHNAIHGRMLDVVLDDDSEYYYRGRVTINEWKSERRIGNIVVEVDAEPYKYKLAETVVAVVVTGTNSIVLPNGRKRVVPEITTDAEMKITYGAYTGTFDAGTFTIPELALAAGKNTVKVTGTGNISFRYREGVL